MSKVKEILGEIRSRRHRKGPVPDENQTRAANKPIPKPPSVRDVEMSESRKLTLIKMLGLCRAQLPKWIQLQITKAATNPKSIITHEEAIEMGKELIIGGGAHSDCTLRQFASLFEDEPDKELATLIGLFFDIRDAEWSFFDVKRKEALLTELIERIVCPCFAQNRKGDTWKKRSYSILHFVAHLACEDWRFPPEAELSATAEVFAKQHFPMTPEWIETAYEAFTVSCASTPPASELLLVIHADLPRQMYATILRSIAVLVSSKALAKLDLSLLREEARKEEAERRPPGIALA